MIEVLGSLIMFAVLLGVGFHVHHRSGKRVARAADEVVATSKEVAATSRQLVTKLRASSDKHHPVSPAGGT